MKKIVFLILFTGFIAGCTNNNTTLKYYEIVHDRIDCDPYCDQELIVLSNGWMLKKQSDTKGKIWHTVELRKTDSIKAEQAIQFAQNSIQEEKPQRCTNCNEYTFFTQNGSKPFAYISTEEQAIPEVKTVMQKSSQLFSESEKAEQFFFQFVYKKLGQNSIDYHIFPDGTVIKNEFRGGDSKLQNTQIFSLEKEQIDSLKQKISDKLFKSESSISNCIPKSLEYGYLEVLKDDKYIFIWTCGALESEADKLFNEMLKETWHN